MLTRSCIIQTNIPKPSHDPQNSDCIATAIYYDEPGIYRYNIITNQLDLFVNMIVICILMNMANTLTNRIVYDDKHDLAEVGVFPRIAYIPSPINQIHMQIYENECTYHVKHDLETQTITKQIPEALNDEGTACGKLMYIPFSKKLMIFSSDENNRIWECEIDEDRKQESYEWKENN